MSAHLQQLHAAGVGAVATAPGRRAAAPIRPVVAVLRRLLNGVVQARRRRIGMADLARLDDRQLADIGLRREQVPELVLRNGPGAMAPTGDPPRVPADRPRL